jgi:hypothetical protein
MMQIPADMHKWRTKFAWEMIAYAVVMLLMAGFALSAAWFFRTKFLSNPAKMLFLTVSLAFVAAALAYSAIMCVQVSLSTRKHDVKMTELEKQRVPMTLEKLRQELRPENQERFRATTFKMLQSSSPVVKASGSRTCEVRSTCERRFASSLNKYSINDLCFCQHFSANQRLESRFRNQIYRAMQQSGQFTA